MSTFQGKTYSCSLELAIPVGIDIQYMSTYFSGFKTACCYFVVRFLSVPVGICDILAFRSMSAEKVVYGDTRREQIALTDAGTIV